MKKYFIYYLFFQIIFIFSLLKFKSLSIMIEILCLVLLCFYFVKIIVEIINQDE
jgi:hypothetical protein